MAILLSNDNIQLSFEDKEDMVSLIDDIIKEERWVEVEKDFSISLNTDSEVDSDFNISVNGEIIPMGVSGFLGLQKAAGEGKVFSKLLADGNLLKYEELVNDCLQIMNKKTKMLVRCGKIRNITSKNYKPLPQNKLIEIFCDEMDKLGSFRSGTYSHENTSLTYNIKEDDVKEAYYKLLCKYYDLEADGITKDDIMINTQMVTSDTSNSSAKVNFSISNPKSTLILGTGLKVDHQGDASIDKFKNKVKDLLGTYRKSFYNVCALTEIPIMFPDGCLINMAKSCDLPRKVAKQVAVEMMEALDGMEVNAFDVYALGLSQIYNKCKCSGMTTDQLFVISEKISRALTKDFKAQDNPYND